MTTKDLIRYRISADDRIVFVNESWDSFASVNASTDVKSVAVLGQPLWSYISDLTTEHLYREMVLRAREGAEFSFRLRCDSADCRRQLEMRVAGLPTGEVEFAVRTLSESWRPPVALLEPSQPRSEELLRLCSWCKKVALADGWHEVEDAVAALSLFDHDELPGLTHGICESCLAQVSAVLGGSPGTPG